MECLASQEHGALDGLHWHRVRENTASFWLAYLVSHCSANLADTPLAPRGVNSER